MRPEPTFIRRRHGSICLSAGAIDYSNTMSHGGTRVGPPPARRRRRRIRLRSSSLTDGIDPDRFRDVCLRPCRRNFPTALASLATLQPNSCRIDARCCFSFDLNNGNISINYTSNPVYIDSSRHKLALVQILSTSALQFATPLAHMHAAAHAAAPRTLVNCAKLKRCVISQLG